jgi:2-(3-amino-3-carboxypropyl)histidine synthase
LHKSSPNFQNLNFPEETINNNNNQKKKKKKMADTTATTAKKRFIGKSGGAATKNSSTRKPAKKRTNEVPREILENELLNQLIQECLPKTYHFELHKTIHQVIQNQVTILGLQMPEGLLQFSLTISDLIRKFCPDCQHVVVLGDVTYGACCVDDFTAKALGCQMLIHYGHSCLSQS